MSTIPIRLCKQVPLRWDGSATLKLHQYFSRNLAMSQPNGQRRIVAETIETKLTERFQPTYLAVRNESHLHNVPADSETHFKVVLVSSQFEGVSPVNRHRQVNAVLAHELQTGVHALSLVTKTPQQWEDMQQQGKAIAPSPKCRGGDGSLPSR